MVIDDSNNMELEEDEEEENIGNCLPGQCFVHIPDEADPEIYHDEFLTSLGLCINLSASAIVCKECGNGLSTSSVKNHLRIHLPTRLFHDHKSELSTESLLSRFPDKLVDHSSPWCPPTLPIRALSYLKTSYGFTCLALEGGTDCFFSVLTEKRLRRHIQQTHEQPSCYAASKTYVQTFFSGNLRRFFPVMFTPSVPKGAEVLYQLFTEKVEEMNRVLSPSELLNERNVHPFYRKSRWYELTAKFELRHALSLISPTIRKKEPFEERVKVCVKDYFHKVNTKLGKGRVHYQILNSLSVKDPDTG
jgi:hypothetical protein